MKTVFNTKIHKVMKNYNKYICAFVLLLGMSVNAWGYTVKFETGMCNPTIDDVAEAYNNAGITLPDGVTPAATGWEFVGWATASCSESTKAPVIYQAGTEEYKPGANITMYAVYRKYTSGTSSVTFDASDISNLTEHPVYSRDWVDNTAGIELYLSAGQHYTGGTPNTWTVTKSTDKAGTANDVWNYAMISAYRKITQIDIEISETSYKIEDDGTGIESDADTDDYWAMEVSSPTVEPYTQTVSYTGDVNDFATQVWMYATTAQQIRAKTITITYYNAKFNSNPSDTEISLSKGTQTNATISSFSPVNVPTCSSTDADRNVTITVEAATGYEFLSTARLTYSGDGTASYVSGPTGSGPYTFVYRFAKDDDGNGTFSVTSATAKAYTINLDGNNGTGHTSSVTATYNSSTLSSSITNPTREGYTFDGWYSGSGGTGSLVINTSGVLQANVSTYTDASSNWIKDADVQLYAKWTINKYKVTLASPTTVTISATSPSIAEGAYTEVNYGSAVTLSYSSLVEGRQWSGWKVTKDEDGSNVTASVISTNTLTVPAYDVTVNAEVYGGFAFSCAELTLTPHLATMGTPIFITSTASKTVRSQDYIEITGDGLTPNTALSFGELGKFAIKNADGTAVTTDVNGEISANAYIFYTPDAGDTSDGLDKLTGITVSVGGAKPKTVNLTQDIIGRHLPADFVIAVKHDDNQWYALPADLGNASNPFPVAIRVNNESNPTIAYCANTNSYTLYQDNVSNSQKVILGTTNNKNGSGVSYALWGSPGDNTLGINTSVVVTGNPGDQYKWTLTQTATSISTIADAKYNIRVSGNSNDLKLRTNAGLTKWGFYVSGVKELRLLTLSEVAPMTMKVMEWGTDAIVVSYPNGGSATSPQARIGDGDAANVTLTSLGGDIYKITTISGLQDNPAKTLIITATESGTGKQALFPIPLIVTTAKTEAELRTAAGSNDIAKLTDVIIRDGGRVTTGTASGNFNDVYIYPGGKAKITNNFAANNIYMRGGYSFLDEKATFRYPDLCVEGAVTIDLPAANKLYYDFYIDNRKYYMFSMPQDVTLVSVTDEAGYDDFPVWVKHYDGNLRASGHGVSGWTWYGDEEGQGSFKAGIGYEITAKPKTSGRPIAIIRFPVITGDITTDAEHAPEIAISNYGKDAYDAGTQSANNVGWNFLGNPYLTEYKAVSDTNKMVASGFVQHIDRVTGLWDGTYDWEDSKVRFLTVPYDTENDYNHVQVKEHTIPAFSTFFFQYDAAAEGTFTMGGTRTQAAAVPARFGAAPKAVSEIGIDIILNGEGEAVNGSAGLIIHDKYDGGLKDFEDVEQWFVDKNVQKTYTFASGTALAYNLLNEEAIGELIPMGYIATVGGEHVYALNEENDVSALEHLWLIDYTTGVTTDLLVRNYSFVTAAGRFDSRFAINAVLKQEEVATNISNTAGGDWTTTIGVYSGENMLTLRGLPDNSAVYIYDMNGRLLQSSEKLSNIASFSIATQGVYNIRVIADGKAITLRTVLR